DDIVFHLLMDEPLAGGEVGVRYEVASEDGHVVSGGFSFIVADVIATTTTMGPTTTTRSATTTSRPSPTSAPIPATTVPVAVAVEGEAAGTSSTPILIVAIVLSSLGGGVYLARRSRVSGDE
ncbi:MAG: hypothetical protein WAL25_12845, partial [Acidimicrobiia bacterium]